MKKINRIISLFLALSMLLSALAVLSFADGEGGDTTPDDIQLYINRTYDEGWDYTNGILSGSAMTKGNLFEISREADKDGYYNYFLRLEALNTDDGFLDIKLGESLPDKGYVIEFDIKLDSYCNLGNIVELRSRSGKWIFPLAIKDNKIVFSPNRSSNLLSYDIGDGEWAHVSYEFDFTPCEEDKLPTVTVTFGDAEPYTYELPKEFSSGLGIFRVCFDGKRNTDTIGMSYCLDNFKAYGGTNKVTDVSSLGYGMYVDAYAAKTIEIVKDASNENAVTSTIEQALVMKVGVNNMLLRGKKAAILDGKHGAPMRNEKGQVIVPLSILLDYFGYPFYEHPDHRSYDISTGLSATYIVAGRDTATVGSKRASLNVTPGYYSLDGGTEFFGIGIDDIETLFPGYYLTYDDMGLIIIAKQDDVVNRENGLAAMINTMNRFIFDSINDDESTFTGESVIADIAEHFADKEGINTHPRLQATPETFDSLREFYNNPESTAYPEAYRAYMKYKVDYALMMVKLRFGKNADGNYEFRSGKFNFRGAMTPCYPYQHYYVYEQDASGRYVVKPGKTGTDMYGKTAYGDGYDLGGRSYLQNVTQELRDYGFAYQMLRDSDPESARMLVECFYLYMKALGEWVHWGEGHFLNNADGAKYAILGFDWIYNGFDSDDDGGDARRAEIAQIFYEKTVFPAYAQFIGKYPNPSVRASGVGSYAGNIWVTKNDNWVEVCSSGVLLTCLGIADFTGMTAQFERVTYPSETVLPATIKYIMVDVIDSLHAYAPDGSFMESSTYWAYGTNAFFLMVEGLVSATGRDYGYMDSYGMDNTCYYALHIESSDLSIWPYHDANPSSMETHMYSFAGHWYGSSDIVKVRYNRVVGGESSCQYEDLFYYYPEDVAGDGKAESLDYLAEGIDTYLARSSWERGAIYTGLHGGPNFYDHGNIDSGNFIYNNRGVEWIVDLGADNYNAPGYWPEATRYKYYRMSAEGQNTLIFKNDALLPYGQVMKGRSDITDYRTNGFGSYAVLDMLSAYGAELVNDAKRGMLFTNDRTTVVLQDEMQLKAFGNLYWIAHINRGVRVEIDPNDSKVVYLSSDKVVYDENGAAVRTDTFTIRLTLLTANQKLRFEKTDAYTTFLDGTYKTDRTTMGGAETEYDRNGYTKLYIKLENVISVNMAVVIEDITEAAADGTLTADKTKDVGYEIVPMREWEPIKEFKPSEVADNTVRRGELTGIANRIESYMRDPAVFTKRLHDLYKLLSDEMKIYIYYREDLNTTELAAMAKFFSALDAYNAYRESVAVMNGNIGDVAKRMMGI